MQLQGQRAQVITNRFIHQFHEFIYKYSFFCIDLLQQIGILHFDAIFKLSF